MQSTPFQGHWRAPYPSQPCQVDEIIYMCVLPAAPKPDAFGFPLSWQQNSHSKCRRDRDYVTAEEPGARSSSWSLDQPGGGGKTSLKQQGCHTGALKPRPLLSQQRFTPRVLHHSVSQPLRAALKGAPVTHSLTRERADLNLTPRPCAGNKAQMCQPLKRLFLLCFRDTHTRSLVPFLSSR